MKRAFIISTMLVPFFLSAFLLIHAAILFYMPYAGEDKVFVVKPGSGFSRINANLEREKIISDARVFHYYVKFKDKLGSFKAGSFLIKDGMNMGDVLETLVEGTPILTQFTIPEGKNLYEIATILEEKKITKAQDFIKVCKSQKLKKEFDINAPSVEGYLFPETYKFAPGSDAYYVASSMIKVFQDKTKNLMKNYKGKLNFHELIILASIVEKETGASFERRTIAGVYTNRLNKPMRLQADPTTIYGIWEKYNGNLRKKHLLEKTPYNTYKINGLPLGPIANPSLAAIKAAINPEKHSYLYFVSKNDGTHIFTPTYKEHLRAVNFWQKNRSNRAGKSWRDLKEK